MISIVLPTYNGEKYIRKSIESIINQTYENWELIVIDDCSTDSTNDIIQEYIASDSRITLYRNTSNLKLPASLNKGFSLSRGDYLTWTSDDNVFYSNALEVLYKKLKSNPELGLVFADMDYIDEYGRIVGHTSEVRTKKEIYYKNIVLACFMYTRKAYRKIGDYNVNRFLVEDYEYWLRIVNEFEFEHINQTLYKYRKH